MVRRLTRPLRAFLHRFHRWDYRNPYDRTCHICGRHEVEHRWHTEPGIGNRSWWEVFADGDPSKHRLPEDD